MTSAMRYFRAELDDHSSAAPAPPASATRSRWPSGAAPRRLMTDLIVRPEGARARRAGRRRDASPSDCSTTQAPQRPQSSAPVIRIEVDGRVVEGREGQTILEVCRDNGIEIPTLCYEPKLPGFGACRMCVVEVEGEEHPPISCSRRGEAGMKVQTQTEEVRRLRATNLELIFSDHNAYCLPPCQNKCPSHIDIPGFLKQNAEGELARVDPDLQADDPLPERARTGLPGAVRGALPARRGRRGDRHPRQPPLRRRPGHQGDARRRDRPAAAVRAPAEDGPPGGRHRVRPGRDERRLLPPPGRSRRDRLRARPGARRDAPLRDPAVPAARRSRSSRPSTSRSPGWAAKIVCNQGLGRDFTLDDLQGQGYDAVLVAIGCYDTNKLGIPNEDADGVIDGLEYLQTATLGLPYPGHTRASASS